LKRSSREARRFERDKRLLYLIERRSSTLTVVRERSQRKTLMKRGDISRTALIEGASILARCSPTQDDQHFGPRHLLDKCPRRRRFPIRLFIVFLH
jgi:hypothetical protein